MKMKYFSSLLIALMALSLHADQQVNLSVERCCGDQKHNQKYDDFVGLCCERGPRGPRGHRGHRGRMGATGATGATGADANIMGELFLNALQMTHSGTEALLPVTFFFPYGSYPVLNGSPVAGYRLAPRDAFVDGVDRVGVNFTVPNDLDITQPVTVTLHFVVPKFSDEPMIGDQARILIEADYKGDYELIGITPPATGFVELAESPDFLVVEPSVTGTENLMHFTTVVSLDPSLMTPGDWLFLQISRIPPAANEYQENLYITTLVFQYSRIVS